MPQLRVAMRKIREILRLAWSCGQSRKAIAVSCGVGKTTVTDTIARAAAANLSWPLPDLDDDALERMLYPVISHPVTRIAEPDWPSLHNELTNRKNLPSCCCGRSTRNPILPDTSTVTSAPSTTAGTRSSISPCARNTGPGRKLFVDYCGQTIPIVDAATGEIHDAPVFVAVMGASNFTYAEATWSQSLPDWIGVHVRTFAFLGGVPMAVVPDNLRSAVTRACRYEPEINTTFAEMGAHYGTAIIPTRVRRPKDKAKAEVGVQIVQRFILAGLRNRTFFSLAEANAAIRERLDKLNNRPFRKLPGNRLSRFLEIDCPALLPLPSAPYEFAHWLKARVHIDYHVEVKDHFYSVPHRLRGEQLDVRFTETTVECFHKNNRVASHQRSFSKGRHTTLEEHMPTAHREYAEWTPERLIKWASTMGPATAAVVEEILSRRAVSRARLPFLHGNHLLGQAVHGTAA